MEEAQPYRPDPAILSLGGEFYDEVAAARFPMNRMRIINRKWAPRVGLTDIDWPGHFARFEPLEGNLPVPLALRYHGHQFRHYNPELGDGRGFLFAQLRDGDGRLLDLGTKGSGQTPWSRQGDGRLTLKGGVREVLASEMLEALGVNTSKTFALVETGEALKRGDEPSPTRSAVLTRLSHGHIRIGTFQRLAYFEDVDSLHRLTAYVLEQLYGEAPSVDPAEAALRLFDLVVGRTARLAAQYVASGFVHGVLNSDNINVTGESFDYGPWRFAPEWDENFTAAYFDHAGLYAFGRQPEAIQWDVAQLGGCFALVADGKAFADTLATFVPRFEREMVTALLARLGIAARGDDSDRTLTSAALACLRTRTVGIDRFFFDWRGGRDVGGAAYEGEAFDALRAALTGRQVALAHPYWSRRGPVTMLIDEVEAIWDAIAARDDWGPLEAKLADIRILEQAMTAA